MANQPISKEPGEERRVRAKQDMILKAICALIKNAQGSSCPEMCLECGSAGPLATAIVSRYSSGETWEVTLPLCEVCATKIRTNSTLHGDETTAATRHAMKDSRLQ